jgi:hypothetical protein
MIVAAALTLLASCGGSDGGDEATAGAETNDSGMAGMAGMEGMARMGGLAGMEGMGDSTMMEMRSQMEEMMGMNSAGMAAMMPEHRQMAANMLAQMNREMEQMSMTRDSAWVATVDSLRQDLVQMPGMGADEFPAFMPAHRDRVMRLMEMHDSMMGR